LWSGPKKAHRGAADSFSEAVKEGETIRKGVRRRRREFSTLRISLRAMNKRPYKPPFWEVEWAGFGVLSGEIAETFKFVATAFELL
jgi:hypothetical protein